jgi:hypothetical protein
VGHRAGAARSVGDLASGSSLGPLSGLLDFDGVGQQRGGGVERDGEPVERCPGGVAEPVLDPFEVFGAQLGVGGDLFDREALGGAQPFDGAAGLGSVGGGASVAAPAGLGFDGRWFAPQAEVDGEDLADALDPDPDPHVCVIDLGRALGPGNVSHFTLELLAHDTEGTVGGRVSQMLLEHVATLLIMVVFPDHLKARGFSATEREARTVVGEAQTLEPRREDSNGNLLLDIEHARQGHIYELAWNY